MDGLIEPGNLNLLDRPRVRNADGSISTVRSMSVNMDGMEVLLPTVSDDGRMLNDDEAVDQYRRTGMHLGKFDTPDNATAYAHQLHNDQERQYVGTEAGMAEPQKSPQQSILEQARGMLTTANAPMNANNLNRAMQIIAGQQLSANDQYSMDLEGNGTRYTSGGSGNRTSPLARPAQVAGSGTASRTASPATGGNDLPLPPPQPPPPGDRSATTTPTASGTDTSVLPPMPNNPMLSNTARFRLGLGLDRPTYNRPTGTLPGGDNPNSGIDQLQSLGLPDEASEAGLAVPPQNTQPLAINDGIPQEEVDRLTALDQPIRPVYPLETAAMGATGLRSLLPAAMRAMSGPPPRIDAETSAALKPRMSVRADSRPTPPPPAPPAPAPAAPPPMERMLQDVVRPVGPSQPLPPMGPAVNRPVQVAVPQGGPIPGPIQPRNIPITQGPAAPVAPGIPPARSMESSEALRQLLNPGPNTTVPAVTRPMGTQLPQGPAVPPLSSTPRAGTPTRDAPPPRSGPNPARVVKESEAEAARIADAKRTGADARQRALIRGRNRPNTGMRRSGDD